MGEPDRLYPDRVPTASPIGAERKRGRDLACNGRIRTVRPGNRRMALTWLTSVLQTKCENISLK